MQMCYLRSRTVRVPPRSTSSWLCGFVACSYSIPLSLPERLCFVAGDRPLTLTFVKRQEGGLDTTNIALDAPDDMPGANSTDPHSVELLPPTVLKAQEGAAQAERERLEAEAEVAALEAELRAAEEMLRAKREAKKRRDEEVLRARATKETP